MKDSTLLLFFGIYIHLVLFIIISWPIFEFVLRKLRVKKIKEFRALRNWIL